MINLIFLDVDGCLTDGRVIYTSEGGWVKEFHVRDGAAMQAWLKLGGKIAIITGRSCPCVTARARELGVDLVRQGVEDKLSCAREILTGLNMDFSHTAAIGDYFNDASLLAAVGLSFKPRDAHRELRADIHLKVRGGRGAVGEMIEFLVEKNGQKEQWRRLWI